MRDIDNCIDYTKKSSSEATKEAADQADDIGKISAMHYSFKTKKERTSGYKLGDKYYQTLLTVLGVNNEPLGSYLVEKSLAGKERTAAGKHRLIMHDEKSNAKILSPALLDAERRYNKHGSYGLVKSAIFFSEGEAKPAIQVALKCLFGHLPLSHRSNKTILQSAFREVEYWRFMGYSYSSVLTYDSTSQDPDHNSKKLYVLMPWIEGHDLFELSTQYADLYLPSEKLYIIEQLYKILRELYCSYRKLPSDFKPENIMYDSTMKKVFLVDTTLFSVDALPMTATLAYLDDEARNKFKNNVGGFDWADIMYSFGRIANFLMRGYDPFLVPAAQTACQFFAIEYLRLFSNAIKDNRPKPTEESSIGILSKGKVLDRYIGRDKDQQFFLKLPTERSTRESNDLNPHLPLMR